MKNKRPPFEKWHPYLLCLLLAYAIADITILNFRDYFLPKGAPPSRPPPRIGFEMTSRGSYNSVISRNIFNSAGIIPDPLMSEETKNKSEKEADPVPSTLPLALVGTMVHSNPDKSIASIDIKGKNQVLSFFNKQNIENLATITKVERQKVIFRNLNNNRLEFIEIKSASKVNFGMGAAPAPGKTAPMPAAGEVLQTAPNNFTIKRSDLLKYVSDLSSVLQQARAVPNRDPKTGEINGFRLVDFMPTSIYGQLGLQKMDVIKSVNGEPVDSPAKAMELYNALKNSANVKLGIERGGKNEDLSYTVQ